MISIKIYFNIYKLKLMPLFIETSEGKWGLWSAWRECSKTCGGGVQKSHRECLTRCNGPETRSQPCNEQKCTSMFVKVNLSHHLLIGC